jgi:hypothetical protein
MSILTLTPDQYAYLTAIVIVLTVGSTSLAQKIGDALAGRCRLPIIAIHLIILAMLSSTAIYLWGMPRLLPGSPGTLATYVALGFLLGLVAVSLDRFILGRIPGAAYVKRSLRRSVVALLVSATVAFLEEIMFRGYLLDLCFVAQYNIMIGIGVATSTVAFAITHAYAGPTQVLAKLALSLITLISTLLSGFTITAIVIHVIFNLRTTDASVLDLGPLYRRKRNM